jgi:hypothetical protein
MMSRHIVLLHDDHRDSAQEGHDSVLPRDIKDLIARVRSAKAAVPHGQWRTEPASQLSCA